MKPGSIPNRFFLTFKCLRSACTAVLGFAMGGGGVTAQAFTPADADAIFNAHTKAFYEEKDGHAWFKESTDGGKVSYWMRAEQLEMVLDAYERTKNPGQMAMFTKLFHGFLADHGKTWERNEFNDDIMYGDRLRAGLFARGKCGVSRSGAAVCGGKRTTNRRMPA